MGGDKSFKVIEKNRVMDLIICNESKSTKVSAVSGLHCGEVSTL